MLHMQHRFDFPAPSQVMFIELTNLKPIGILFLIFFLHQPAGIPGILSSRSVYGKNHMPPVVREDFNSADREPGIKGLFI